MNIRYYFWPYFTELTISSVFSSVQLLRCVRLFVTPGSTPGFPVHRQILELGWSHVHQVGDAIQPSHPLLSPLLPPSIVPSIRVISNESVLHIRWPKYWSFSLSPSNKYSGLISFRVDWISMQCKEISRVFSNTTVQRHQFFCAQLSLSFNSPYWMVIVNPTLHQENWNQPVVGCIMPLPSHRDK